MARWREARLQVACCARATRPTSGRFAHPGEPATVATAALILGGPTLYVVGHILFKWALWRHVLRSRLLAVAALVALVPVAAASSALALMSAATAVLVALVLWDLRAEYGPS